MGHGRGGWGGGGGGFRGGNISVSIGGYHQQHGGFGGEHYERIRQMQAFEAGAVYAEQHRHDVPFVHARPGYAGYPGDCPPGQGGVDIRIDEHGRHGGFGVNVRIPPIVLRRHPNGGEYPPDQYPPDQYPPDQGPPQQRYPNGQPPQQDAGPPPPPPVPPIVRDPPPPPVVEQPAPPAPPVKEQPVPPAPPPVVEAAAGPELNYRQTMQLAQMMMEKIRSQNLVVDKASGGQGQAGEPLIDSKLTVNKHGFGIDGQLGSNVPGVYHDTANALNSFKHNEMQAGTGDARLDAATFKQLTLEYQRAEGIAASPNGELNKETRDRLAQEAQKYQDDFDKKAAGGMKVYHLDELKKSLDGEQNPVPSISKEANAKTNTAAVQKPEKHAFYVRPDIDDGKAQLAEQKDGGGIHVPTPDEMKARLGDAFDKLRQQEQDAINAGKGKNPAATTKVSYNFEDVNSGALVRPDPVRTGAVDRETIKIDQSQVRMV